MENWFDKVSVFKGISEEAKQAIINMPKREVTYKANQVMARGEDKITEICTIIDGLVKCTDYSNNGEELHSSYFASGVTFPFYMLYGGEENYCFNTYAAKKTTVLWFPWEELKKVVKSDMVLMENILTFVSEYTCYNKMLARCVKYRKVSARLAYWLLHLTRDSEALYFPMSQEILSDILHVNRSSLNPALVALQKQNVIEIKDQQITILDRYYLEDLL